MGVKGARVTLSSRGTTYITVGSGGFYYRQNLSSGSRRTAVRGQVQAAETQPSPEEIKTADVEELLDSSKSELVENLNKRAQMFNPASILFAVAAICVVIGFVELGGSASQKLTTLPDVSAPLGVARQANQTDEYALFLARYGQPSTVTLAQAGSVPLRSATWDGAHIAVTFVPAGCVDSYVYFEAHKNDIVPTRPDKHRHGITQSTEPGPPPCHPPLNKASTVFGYQDAMSGNAMDSGAADRDFSGLSAKSETPPVVKTIEVSQPKRGAPKPAVQPPNVEYDEAAFNGERQRLTNTDAAEGRAVKIAVLVFAGAFLILILGVIVFRRNREKRMTRLVYDLSSVATAQQQTLDESIGNLARSRAIWRLDSQSAVLDWKRNAGAAYNVKREQISVRKSVPRRVESNVVPMCVDLGKLKMFFLPDQVLYWQRGTFASIEYADLSFTSTSTRFIEEQVQTSDSKQVGSTWRYVRKDGGPDRRFNNNRQLPVMLYGVVTAMSSGGLNLVLHTSNVDVASSFTTSFRNFQGGRARERLGNGRQSDRQATTQEQPEAKKVYPAGVESALAVLGLNRGVTLEQVATAYRHMAQMYHPDKTAGLGPELQELADKKMKEINAAHGLVKEYLERA